MKKYLLIIIFILFSFFSKSQTVYELCKGDSIITLYTDNFENYLVDWEIRPPVLILKENDNEIIALFNKEGIYNISAFYYNDYCKSEKSYYIIKVINCVESYVWFPSAFTPNGDGINEIFEIIFLQIEPISLEIFNRWGEMIFNSNGYKWDGYYYDKIVKSDIYVYKFSYKELNGRLRTIIGRVSVIY